MSDLLDALIKQRKQEAIAYEEYLAKIVELTKKAENPGTSIYPASLNTPAKRALYDNLDKDEELAIALDTEIRRVKKDEFRGNKIKEREVRNAIRQHINDEAEVNFVFDLVVSQHEY